MITYKTLSVAEAFQAAPRDTTWNKAEQATTLAAIAPKACTTLTGTCCTWLTRYEKMGKIGMGHKETCTSSHGRD